MKSTDQKETSSGERAAGKSAASGASSKGAAGVRSPDQQSLPQKSEPVVAAQQDGLRETVESIVVAFILAFLFRAFEAEAFVIPTGSMAPTLYGRHKDVHCTQCGEEFAVGASDEIDKDTGYYSHGNRIRTSVCPNCRFENNIEDDLPFKGDRILVNKFPFEIAEPHRWDVTVFKYPEQPQTNYIKRLVGLPGEELRIDRGDVYMRREATDPWQILRKSDPDKQRVLQIPVYDDTHPAREILDAGWPERWWPAKPVQNELSLDNEQALVPRATADWEPDKQGWSADYQTRQYSFDGKGPAGEFHWLRYSHFVPSQSDWRNVRIGAPFDPEPRPQMVTDFCAYNAYTGGDFRQDGLMTDVFWVGDLTVETTLDIEEARGELVLELVEGVRRYRWRIDLTSGEATLWLLDEQLDRDRPERTELGKAATNLNRPGSYNLAFANVDQRLCLWINDRLVPFSRDGAYHPPAYPGPQRGDLHPAGIAVSNAKLTVSELRIFRDIYYRAERYPDGGGGRDSEFNRSDHYLLQLLHDPEAWGNEYDANHQVITFDKLASDEYFMLGDNSPRSQDSRLWPNDRNAENRHAVPRSALVGKAFFIYWPHGVPFLRQGKGYALNFWPVRDFFYHATPPGQPKERDYPKFTVPFYPHVSRMHRIR